MLNKRRDAAHKVAAGLFAVEEAIDLALTRAAELSALLPTVRTEANLSAIVGQEAFEGCVGVQATLAAARRQIVETHKCLDETKTQIGLRTMAVGDGTAKPPPPSGLAVVDGGASIAA